MAPPSSKDETKKLIVTAAFAGHLNVLKKLQRDHDDGSGIEKILDDFGRNARHGAAAGSSAKKLKVVKYLVEKLKFNVNEQDANGDTPLHISTLEEDYETSAYLLDHGADPTIAMSMGFTPLHYAAKNGRTNLLRLLISKGAQIDAPSFVGTPLQAAAVHDRIDAVEFLLKNHANPNLACPNTLPPLMSAIITKCLICARSLIEWGADPNIVSNGMTPLTVAASEAQTDIIKRLVDVGADPNVPDFYGHTPIEISARLGRHADVMALLDVTTPISGISDWIVRGIIEHVRSPDAKNKEKLTKEQKLLEAKEKGAEAVKKDFILMHHAGILRSLCWSRLKEGNRAIEDSLACIELRDDWPKAHYRAGVAWGLLLDYEKAEKEFKIALDLDPDNKELQDTYREAVLDVHAVEMDKKKQGLPSKYDVDPNDELYEDYMASII